LQESEVHASEAADGCANFVISGRDVLEAMVGVMLRIAGHDENVAKFGEEKLAVGTVGRRGIRPRAINAETWSLWSGIAMRGEVLQVRGGEGKEKRAPRKQVTWRLIPMETTKRTVLRIGPHPGPRPRGRGDGAASRDGPSAERFERLVCLRL
jgi:hypothetical protein